MRLRIQSAECVRIAPHNLLTQGVGHSDDPCGDVAATVREEWHRLVGVVKVRLPSKNLIIDRKHVIHPSIELILMVPIVSNQSEIVGGSRLGRLRVVVKHGKRSRIYSAFRNNIRR